MRFERDFHWQHFQHKGTCTFPLTLPPDAPASLRAGSWTLEWVRPERYLGGDTVSLRWEGVKATPRFRSFQLELLDSADERGGATFEGIEFPSGKQGSVSVRLTKHVSCGLRVTLSIEGSDNSLAPEEKAPSELARQFANLSLAQIANDVLLDFPRSGRQLWTSENLLLQSPYFASLLSSDFAESSKAPTALRAKAAGEPLFFDDSGDEEKVGIKPSSALSPSQASPHKTVTVTKTSYATYLAVVCWLQSGHIAFAPLASTFLSTEVSEGEAFVSRKKSISSSSTAHIVDCASLLPVSPKSVYRLSHLLDLPSLSSLALSNFSSQLTVSNAAHELFSETSGCYNEVWNAVVEFIARYSDKVRGTERWKEAEERAGKGTMAEWEGAIWARVASRLARRE
ncbi:hypothetical protein JCM6882_005475 [Rhodosporidiobolus microsporus]